MRAIDEFPIVRSTALVFEHGWQSWSPSTTYQIDERPWRPVNERNRVICYRPDTDPSADVFWGEGLLAVDPGNGTGIRIYAVHDATESVPSIQCEVYENRLLVSATGAVDCIVDTGPGTMDNALARWADQFAGRAGVNNIRKAPSIWCSWYH